MTKHISQILLKVALNTITPIPLLTQVLILLVHRKPNFNNFSIDFRVFNLFLIEFKRLEYLHGYLLEYTK